MDLLTFLETTLIPNPQLEESAMQKKREITEDSDTSVESSVDSSVEANEEERVNGHGGQESAITPFTNDGEGICPNYEALFVCGALPQGRLLAAPPTEIVTPLPPQEQQWLTTIEPVFPYTPNTVQQDTKALIDFDSRISSLGMGSFHSSNNNRDLEEQELETKQDVEGEEASNTLLSFWNTPPPSRVDPLSLKSTVPNEDLESVDTTTVAAETPTLVPDANAILSPVHRKDGNQDSMGEAALGSSRVSLNAETIQSKETALKQQQNPSDFFGILTAAAELLSWRQGPQESNQEATATIAVEKDVELQSVSAINETNKTNSFGFLGNVFTPLMEQPQTPSRGTTMASEQSEQTERRSNVGQSIKTEDCSKIKDSVSELREQPLKKSPTDVFSKDEQDDPTASRVEEEVSEVSRCNHAAAGAGGATAVVAATNATIQPQTINELEVTLSKSIDSVEAPRRRHCSWFAYGKFWTVFTICFTGAALATSILSRQSVAFVSLTNSVHLSPKLMAIDQVGLVRLELCKNMTYVEVDGDRRLDAEPQKLTNGASIDIPHDEFGDNECLVLELNTQSIDDPLWDVSRTFISMAVWFGFFFTLMLSTSIFWESINLKPIALGLLVTYFFQCLGFFFFDSDLCRKHGCSLDQGSHLSILSAILWFFSGVLTMRMDISYHHRLQMNQQRYEAEQKRQAKKERRRRRRLFAQQQTTLTDQSGGSYYDVATPDTSPALSRTGSKYIDFVVSNDCEEMEAGQLFSM